MYNVKLYFFYKLSYYSKTKQVDRLLVYMSGRREMFNIDVKLTPEDESEVLRYLQHNGKDIDENLHAQVLECMNKINAVAKPNFVFREWDLENKGEFPAELDFFVGNSIKKHIKDCHKLILMAATIGVGVDNAIRKEELKNVANALIMDSCGSTLIEAVCDSIEAGFREQYLKENNYLTFRFSPGYGDLPITIQRQFVNVVNATRRIGVNVSDSGIMLPRKSVTAIIGVSDQKLETLKKSCAGCNLLKSCRYRKIGVRCYA